MPCCSCWAVVQLPWGFVQQSWLDLVNHYQGNWLKIIKSTVYSSWLSTSGAPRAKWVRLNRLLGEQWQRSSSCLLRGRRSFLKRPIMLDPLIRIDTFPHANFHECVKNGWMDFRRFLSILLIHVLPALLNGVKQKYQLFQASFWMFYFQALYRVSQQVLDLNLAEKSIKSIKLQKIRECLIKFWLVNLFHQIESFMRFTL